jgi:1,4-alpha-glucan branching enzyme
MIETVSNVYNFQQKPVRKLWEKDDDQVLAFMRGDLVFVFNFNPSKSFDGYGILAPGGSYKVVLDTDRSEFGGYNNVDDSVEHLTQSDELYAPAGVEWLRLYLPARTAMVLKKK